MGANVQNQGIHPVCGEGRHFRCGAVAVGAVRAVFIHCFAKNARDNIERDELAALKKLAAELLAYDDRTLARVVAAGALVEVNCDEEAVP